MVGSLDCSSWGHVLVVDASRNYGGVDYPSTTVETRWWLLPGWGHRSQNSSQSFLFLAQVFHMSSYFFVPFRRLFKTISTELSKISIFKNQGM